MESGDADDLLAGFDLEVVEKEPKKRKRKAVEESALMTAFSRFIMAL